jgi:hypothetical protein
MIPAGTVARSRGTSAYGSTGAVGAVLGDIAGALVATAGGSAGGGVA